jgi:hypothetical protein
LQGSVGACALRKIWPGKCEISLLRRKAASAVLTRNRRVQVARFIAIGICAVVANLVCAGLAVESLVPRLNGHGDVE